MKRKKFGSTRETPTFFIMTSRDVFKRDEDRQGDLEGWPPNNPGLITPWYETIDLQFIQRYNPQFVVYVGCKCRELSAHYYAGCCLADFGLRGMISVGAVFEGQNRNKWYGQLSVSYPSWPAIMLVLLRLHDMMCLSFKLSGMSDRCRARATRRYFTHYHHLTAAQSSSCGTRMYATQTCGITNTMV